MGNTVRKRHKRKSNVPVLIASSVNWEVAESGSDAILALKVDGTLWAWGNNNHGQLGLSNITSRYAPTQVGNLADWAYIGNSNYAGHSAAIKTDGTLWTWGYNIAGQLGLGTSGTSADKSSPVQVGSLTDWAKVSGGDRFTAAIKTDGTLWTWGTNSQYQLGDSTPAAGRSSPVQVGSLTNWKDIACGDQHTLAIKTDGTLWAWGRNSFGQLGDGTVTWKSSPVQIGSFTDWKSVSCGGSSGASSSAATR